MPIASRIPSTPTPTREVRLRRTAATVALFAAGAGLLYARAVPCMFARVVHRPCPGCGSARAVVALLDGDLDGVFANNPFGPAVALLLGVLALQAVVSMARYGDFRDAGAGRVGRALKVLFLVIAAGELALWIARFFGAFGGPVRV
jgi:hypothetical protein